MVHGWPTLYSSVDNILYLIAGLSVVLLLGVTGTMVFFAVRYSRRRNPRPEDIEGNLALEILWTVIPTVLVLAVFYVGWKGFVYKRTVPPNAMLVKVTARMWSWHFAYENGAESAVLKLPVGRPVKLSITSADVLHSLFIPAFRVKEDCVPNMLTYLWFQPDATGSYDLFCSEYCGFGHSGMITTVDVMDQKDFDAWYAGEKEVPAAEEKKPAKPAGERLLAKKEAAPPDGAVLYQTKGCVACHTVDGTPKIGPTFKGLFGKKETVITNGNEREATVDEGFIRQTLLEPEKDRVKGFPPIMPSQKGLMTDEEIGAMVEYLKTLK